jgi:SAM-dependent methyltransferase
VRNRLGRRLGVLGAGWAESLPEELRFWESALRDPDRHWLRSEFDERMNPDLELQDFLRALIPAAPGSTVRLLDVGAGPLTRLGKRWEGRRLELIPVDPLAGAYRQLMDRLGLKPPVSTEEGHGEKLLERFAADSFDLAYASNALDHSYDPMLAIEQMFAVVKPGGSVYLWHFAHVGIAEGYEGLHQWDFERKGDDMTISNGKGVRLSLATTFAGRGEVHCHLEKFLDQTVVVARVRKLPKTPA